MAGVGQVQGLQVVRSPHLEALFPKLHETMYRITSPEESHYNCIAWAAGDDKNWWEPGLLEDYYWPKGVPQEYSVEAYAKAFEALDYEACEDGGREAGFEKVALYADDEGPTHAARQLPDGHWTSKLGKLEDIEHTLEGLSECDYGQVVMFMKRLAGHHPDP